MEAARRGFRILHANPRETIAVSGRMLVKFDELIRLLERCNTA